jgi:hypothetical protein
MRGAVGLANPRDRMGFRPRFSALWYTLIVLDAPQGNYLCSNFSFRFTPRLKALHLPPAPEHPQGAVLIIGNSTLPGSVSHGKILVKGSIHPGGAECQPRVTRWTLRTLSFT